jgi:DNA invertase Pin-like site-specific DNA recombinase
MHPFSPKSRAFIKRYASKGKRYNILCGSPAPVSVGVLFTLEQLKSWGVQYRSMQESCLDSLGPYSDVVVLLLSTIAKLERERIRERTLSGLSRARKDGRIGGRPPGDADTKLVTHIHRLKAAGKSIREIAEEAGTSRSTVQRLLAAA